MEYVVAGGGLAGLTAAAHLAESGADVRVFERADRVGGRVASRTVDGYTLDRGFQVLFTAYPAVRRELDLDALDLRSFTPGATIARPGERSVLADPLGAPGEAIETLLNREVQFGDKLRVFRLQRALAGDEPADILRRGGSTTADYLVAQGFSRAFVESFAKPFFGGITLDRSLGTDSAVFEYAFKMMAEGRTAVPADGMGAIPAQLAERARAAGARIETGRTVDAVDGGDEADADGATVTVGGEAVAADGVVVATDPPTARELTGVDGIPTEGRGCVTQYVSLPSGGRPETDRRLVLNAADDRPNHVAPMSRVAPEYAPEGRELYAATFLGTQENSDTALFDEVRSALSRWYPEASFADLEHVATDRIPFAQFEQPPGFLARLPAPTAPAGPVVLAGDYTRWSSIQGALESGRIAAETLLE
ncbi:NAD(P)/FAD-dependent oxidoreductase [Halomicrobium urmianum]|uniref:NAD(P)/FAD-dependent oxidoreductase n=1 Tax=Halomicrobium urmianum TaxID=1586233 RepID=UPI001CD9780B|nr:NAD(P)/FAD-dependent oxidoreductase [Halomicrobium urmianum]